MTFATLIINPTEFPISLPIPITYHVTKIILTLLQPSYRHFAPGTDIHTVKRNHSSQPTNSNHYQLPNLPTYQPAPDTSDAMDANGEFDVNSLTQRDKQELQQFIQNETQKSKLQQCMSPPLPLPNLSQSPPTCQFRSYSPSYNCLLAFTPRPCGRVAV